jgi:hypothetical protein
MMIWLSVFSVSGHIRVWIILCFIILFIYQAYLRSRYVRRDSPLAPSWYRENRELSFSPWLLQRVSNLLLYSFCHSRIIISFWWYDNWSHTLIHLLFILWGRLSDLADQSTRFIVIHSPRALSPWKTELQFMRRYRRINIKS